jgi:hypothetical protein
MAIPVDEDHRSTWHDTFGVAGSSAVRLALLFGSAALALTFILTPMAEKQVARSADASIGSGIDQIATGSTQASTRGLAAKHSYTIRRSVLQNDKNDICIIGSDGVRTGSC